MFDSCRDGPVVRGELRMESYSPNGDKTCHQAEHTQLPACDAR